MVRSKNTFVCTLEKFNSKLWAYHVVIPAQAGNKFVSGTDHRVLCTLNETLTFQTALISKGDGNYFINLNKQIRDKLKLKEGSEVAVRLAKDTSEYGLPMPAEFKELLKQDEKGDHFFHALTAGKQRTLLYIVGKPKSADLRIRNGIAVLEHLKKTGGQIDYKQLNLDIKNTF